MFEELRSSIRQNIRQNDTRSITGDTIQQILLSMTDATEQSIEITPIVYAELLQLRNASKLQPGHFYLITDYETTTTQANTRSAGHQFDIIVQAIDERTLSESAHAALHDGDAYFTEAGAKLNAWQIWYCLDNDAKRFVWADAENGKGVIYRMIDEWQNDCPYDFKNMMFKREVYEGTGEIAREEGDGDFELYCYTFSWQEEDQQSIVDASIVNNLPTALNDEGLVSGVYNNHIEPCSAYAYYIVDTENPSAGFALNNIVFLDTWHSEDGITYGCYNNRFAGDCCDNSFGPSCNNNAFGNSCNNNAFGNSCSSNTFGNNCGSNAFGNGCDNNAFGKGCDSNVFGNNCYNNAFGNNCYNNAFGNDCNYNAFGNSCSSNAFGEGCHSNAFGNSCYSNAFGNYCNNNAFGNDCNYNALPNYCYYNEFDSGVKYAVIQNTQTASGTNLVQYYHVTLGVVGTGNAKKIIQATRNNKVMTVVGVDASGNIQTITPFA